MDNNFILNKLIEENYKIYKDKKDSLYFITNNISNIKNFNNKKIVFDSHFIDYDLQDFKELFTNNNFFIYSDNEYFLNKKEQKYLFLKEDLLILIEKSINNIELNINKEKELVFLNYCWELFEDRNLKQLTNNIRETLVNNNILYKHICLEDIMYFSNSKKILEKQFNDLIEREFLIAQQNMQKYFHKNYSKIFFNINDKKSFLKALILTNSISCIYKKSDIIDSLKDYHCFETNYNNEKTFKNQEIIQSYLQELFNNEINNPVENELYSLAIIKFPIMSYIYPSTDLLFDKFKKILYNCNDLDFNLLKIEDIEFNNKLNFKISYKNNYNITVETINLFCKNLLDYIIINFEENEIANSILNIKYYGNSLAEKIFINNNLKNDNIKNINFVNKI